MKKMYEIIGATVLSLYLGSSSADAATMQAVRYNGGNETTTQESRNGRTVLLPEAEEQTLEKKVNRWRIFAHDADGCWRFDLDLGIFEAHYESPSCRK